jgi:hypothetical protein
MRGIKLYIFNSQTEVSIISIMKGGVQYNEKIPGYNAYNDNGPFYGSCDRLPEEGRGPEAG